MLLPILEAFPAASRRFHRCFELLCGRVHDPGASLGRQAGGSLLCRDFGVFVPTTLPYQYWASKVNLVRWIGHVSFYGFQKPSSLLNCELALVTSEYTYLCIKRSQRAFAHSPVGYLCSFDKHPHQVRSTNDSGVKF